MVWDNFGYDWLQSIVVAKKHKGYHSGIDFNFGKGHADFGLPVLACMDGIVVCAEYKKDGWGNKVVIEHDYRGRKIYSRYGHNRKLFVKVGDKVKSGQKIGECGNTGASTGPHLHFDIMNIKQPTWGSYIYGWSKAKVELNYLNPKTFLNI